MQKGNIISAEHGSEAAKQALETTRRLAIEKIKTSDSFVVFYREGKGGGVQSAIGDELEMPSFISLIVKWMAMVAQGINGANKI